MDELTDTAGLPTLTLSNEHYSGETGDVPNSIEIHRLPAGAPEGRGRWINPPDGARKQEYPDNPGHLLAQGQHYGQQQEQMPLPPVIRTSC